MAKNFNEFNSIKAIRKQAITVFSRSNSFYQQFPTDNHPFQKRPPA